MENTPNDAMWPETDDVEGLDRTHRPQKLRDFVGQSDVVDHLDVSIRASIARSEPLDHVLFCGPPGLGKTTLAGIIASEMQVPFEKTSGPVLERPKDLAAILARLTPNCVLFIDEIHRMGPAVEEILYPAMEDFEIDLVIGEGPAARSIKLRLSPFTLVGATTRTSLLTRPLLDRFGLVEQLDYYKDEDLVAVLDGYADKLGVAVEPESSQVIARRSRGTPRVALSHFRRVRDFAEVKQEAPISPETTKEALLSLGVDQLGLNKMHRKYLDILVNHYQGGPTGLGTLAASLGDDPRSVEEVVEPYLIRLGLIDRTPRGRVATLKATKHIETTSK